MNRRASLSSRAVGYDSRGSWAAGRDAEKLVMGVGVAPSQSPEWSPSSIAQLRAWRPSGPLIYRSSGRRRGACSHRRSIAAWPTCKRGLSDFLKTRVAASRAAIGTSRAPTSGWRVRRTAHTNHSCASARLCRRHSAATRNKTARRDRAKLEGTYGASSRSARRSLGRIRCRRVDRE